MPHKKQAPEPVAVAEIEVPRERLRPPNTQIDSLAADIAHQGLQSPICVTPAKVLVYGLRRLQAVKELGWRTIPAFVREYTDLQAELAELSENLEREELDALGRIQHRTRKVEILAATRKTKGRGRPHTNKPAKLADLSVPKTSEEIPEEVLGMDEIAASMGTSVRTLRREMMINFRIQDGFQDLIEELDLSIRHKQRELERLSREGSANQARILAVMATVAHRTGKDVSVFEAKRQLVRVDNEVLSEEAETIPKGGAARYRTVVIDPPWKPEDSDDVDPFGKIAPAYKTMTLDEIRDHGVERLMDEEGCHIYLWITNRMLRHGFDLLGHWGVRYVTMLTWVKHRMGTGHYFRNTTEHVLFGVKGSLPLRRTDATTAFEGKRTSHSRKPDAFYDLVESCSYGPYVDVFGRGSRQGWDTRGAEASVTPIKEAKANVG